MKKTLVFHRGRAPKGVRTSWIMHEYRTTEPEFECGEQGGYVLSRLFKKPEEKTLNHNDDEAMNGGYPQTNSKPSPVDEQLFDDEIEDFPTPLDQTLAGFQLCGEPSSQKLNQTIKKQSARKIRWLAEKADSRKLTSNPENSCSNALTTSEIVNSNAEIDPLTNVLEQFCDPYGEQTLDKSFPNVSSPISYTDWSVYNSGYELDHIDEALKIMLASQDKFDEDGTPHSLTVEGQSEDFNREFFYRQVDDSELNIQQGDFHTVISEKSGLPASLPDIYSCHEGSATVRQHGLLFDMHELQQDKTSLESVSGNLDGTNFTVNSIFINPTKNLQNHRMPLQQGRAKRRLRLQKPLRVGVPSCQGSESSSSNGAQGGKKASKEMFKVSQITIDDENLEKLKNISIHGNAELERTPKSSYGSPEKIKIGVQKMFEASQLSIGDENLEKLEKISIHDNAELHRTPKSSYGSSEKIKSSSLPPPNAWKAGALFAYLSRLTLLLIFLFLCIFLWRYVPLSVI